MDGIKERNVNLDRWVEGVGRREQLWKVCRERNKVRQNEKTVKGKVDIDKRR